MNKESFYFTSKDNSTKLHGICWMPEGEPKAVLQLTHGMVEYIDRYDAFARFMAENGFAVIGHDHPGHGESAIDEQHLGYFAKANGYVTIIEDIYQVTEEAKKRFPEKKIFILGHSMGSFMLRRYLALHSDAVSGAIIMGTGFIPALLAGVGHALSCINAALFGEFHRSKMLTGLALGSNNKPFEPARTPFDWLSRNTENVDRYLKDALCGYVFTASAYKDFFKVLKLVAKEDHFETISTKLPILITSGEEDPVGGKAACPKVKEVYDKRGFEDVRLKMYPEDRHEILNEVDRDLVFADILNWINERI